MIFAEDYFMFLIIAAVNIVIDEVSCRQRMNLHAIVSFYDE